MVTVWETYSLPAKALASGSVAALQNPALFNSTQLFAAGYLDWLGISAVSMHVSHAHASLGVSIPGTCIDRTASYARCDPSR